MITRRTKVQLLIFVVITLLGVTYTGARYANLDRFFYDTHYTVVSHFEESGGIFTNAEVTYRGVSVGRVGKLEVTSEGVDVHLQIENDHDRIPADSLALVGNKSAVGEQYVELQPQSDGEPFLGQESEIAMADTRTPIGTTQLLTNLSNTVESVDKPALRTTVSELGQAFEGTGSDLQRIIDTGNSFIDAADANFAVTRRLIRDSNTVLQGQLDSRSAIRSFSRDLALFSGTMADSDEDLRRVIDNGSATANQLRTFLEQNEVDLGELINNLVTTGEVVVKRIDGVEHLLAVYPEIVEGGYTVVHEDPESGMHNAHFGMILTEDAPVCHEGYGSTDRREPQNGENRPMNEQAHCAEPPSKTNARGAHTAPNAPPASRRGSANRAPVVAEYDGGTGEVTWREPGDTELEPTSTLAPRTFGEESWKWLYLQPLQATQE